ncbi:MAG: GTPase HflX [Deltaproteobacteria bacterium]|nr:MAG: GTPase HflX [Deltaproteobacteria bacterium]
MKELYGSLTGLKPNQIKRIEHLYRRRMPPSFLVTPEVAKEMAGLSHEIRRQMGILVDRSGRVTHVLVGDHDQIVIPPLEKFRAGIDRLRGLRCIHTHLSGNDLTRDDLTDLTLLRLDLMAAIDVDDAGHPETIHAAVIQPGDIAQPYKPLSALTHADLDIDCLTQILGIEAEMARLGRIFAGDPAAERAILVGVTTGPKKTATDSLDELSELAQSSGIRILDRILQVRKKIDPRFVMGKGKLNEVAISALQMGATLIIFDRELEPAQIRSITDRIELKVIDRTQLILDIFAQRAQTREGKLQVELAQLTYLLPRLAGKNAALSRLAGGIGGRGPGETQLEIDRRRVRERITRLERATRDIKKQRKQQRSRRSKRGVPVVSIVGYTNAGKSTLLNTLTQSRVTAEDRLFATLDPSSRRIRFPRDLEVIITDTVGFIQDLPKELMAAFRATLEELENADLLVHVIDISNPRYPEQIASVERILADLDLHRIPTLYALNKIDQMPDDFRVPRPWEDALTISAIDRPTLTPLLTRIETALRQSGAAGAFIPEDAAPEGID